MLYILYQTWKSSNIAFWLHCTVNLTLTSLHIVKTLNNVQTNIGVIPWVENTSLYLWSLDSPEKNCNISYWPKMSYSLTFWLLKLMEVISTQESVKRFSYYRQKSLWRWGGFRPTRYITIFLRRIQRLQICKISTDVRGHLMLFLQLIVILNIILTSKIANLHLKCT